MRFTDGLWLRRAGVDLHGAVEVADVQTTNDSLTLIASTKPIRHRGDTLGGPTLTVNLSSPTANIIGITITHFSGALVKGPLFDLFPDGAPPREADAGVRVQKGADSVTLVSGRLEARVDTRAKEYKIEFRDVKTGEVVSASEGKGQAVVDVPFEHTLSSASESSVLSTDLSSNPGAVPNPSHVRFIREELNLDVGENIYGLGERFGPFIKNGQNLSTWNQDGGTSSQQSYKCVPFYLSSKGFGVFVRDAGEVEFEVGAEKCSKVGIAVRGERLEYYFVYGPTLKEVLNRYTLLTGRPGLPPPWTFGLWLSTSFTTSYDSKTVSSFLSGMQDRSIPVRVFHLDCFWMKRYQWCDFTFDPEAFPDPKAYLQDIKSKFGVNICLWINPYIGQASPLFAEGVKEGYFIKRTNGDVWQWDLWQPGLAIVDVFSPSARKWYASKLRKLLGFGVDAFKTDFAERIPHKDVVFADGSDPYKAHNYYTQVYNELVFGVLKERFGEKEAVLFARSATTGGQRFPVHWGGDTESTFAAMAETLRGGLSLTSSGFGFWSHDIGGFEGHPPPAIYKRWCAFGLFSSHSRLHGSASYRVPWNYDDEASVTLAKFVNAKHRLMPYLYSKAIEAHLTGVPLMRALILEFEEDLTAHFIDKQYMLGESLLVAPIFSESTASYHVPAGVWTNFWDGSAVEGGRWIKEEVGFDTIPLLVRPGSVLVLGSENVTKPDYDYTASPEIRVYQLADGQTAHADIPSGKGADIAAKVEVTRIDNTIKAQIVQGTVSSWTLSVYDSLSSKVKGLHGAQADTARGAVVSALAESKEISVELA